MKKDVYLLHYKRNKKKQEASSNNLLFTDLEEFKQLILIENEKEISTCNGIFFCLSTGVFAQRKVEVVEKVKVDTNAPTGKVIKRKSGNWTLF